MQDLRHRVFPRSWFSQQLVSLCLVW